MHKSKVIEQVLKENPTEEQKKEDVIRANIEKMGPTFSQRWPALAMIFVCLLVSGYSILIDGTGWGPLLLLQVSPVLAVKWFLLSEKYDADTGNAIGSTLHILTNRAVQVKSYWTVKYFDVKINDKVYLVDKTKSRKEILQKVSDIAFENQ